MRPRASVYVAKNHRAFRAVWDQKMFKHAKKISRSSAFPGRVTNTFRISSTRATGALNTLRTRLVHVLDTPVYASRAFRFYEI